MTDDARDRVWRRLVHLVMETRSDWRRDIVQVTGLPFSRYRALHRLGDGPVGLKELAESMTIDAPAATVTINDLEERKLVRREPHPTDRRAKLVSLTPAGRRLLEKARAVADRAPPGFEALSASEVAALERALGRGRGG